jgi:transposase
MTTTAKTAAADTILALDLGKYKSVACVHSGASGTSRFTSFETTRSAMHRLLTGDRPTVVIIEACLLAGWVHDLCAELGIRCLVANTASEAWKFKHLKRKTDRDDAQRLAHLYLLELSLTEYRQVCELIDQAETKLDALGKQHADVALLQTAPGLGPRTAEAVAAYLHDAPRFPSAKQVSAYSGLVPRQHQSGEMDRRGRITKRGPALLRKLLVECAWCMVRYNAWARGIYQRLTGGGQRRKKQAIVALARKILVRCWAMLRDRKPWHDPQTGPKPTSAPSKQRRQAEAQQRRQAKQQAAPAAAE